MNFVKLLAILTLISAASVEARVKYDRKEKIKGVSLQSGKEKDSRTYRGYTSKTFPFEMDILRKSITNYTEKCNNAFRKKREFTDKDYDCKYHNEHLIESFIVTDLKKESWVKEHGEVERFLLGRRVYNRGESGYYELVQVFEGKNDDGKKTLIVHQQMLSHDEVKKYTSPKITTDSAFSDSNVKYILTEVTPAVTELKYIYESATEHWVLNKELSVPQVFSTISKSINSIVSNVAQEANVRTREIASEKE